MTCVDVENTPLSSDFDELKMRDLPPDFQNGMSFPDSWGENESDVCDSEEERNKTSEGPGQTPSCHP